MFATGLGKARLLGTVSLALAAAMGAAHPAAAQFAGVHWPH